MNYLISFHGKVVNMANNINARIYKNLKSASKFRNKVNGNIVKKHIPYTITKMGRKINDYKLMYVVYYGEYQ